MSWPRPNGQSFPGRYEQCIGDYCRLVAAVAAREPVNLLVGDAGDDARRRLAGVENVAFHPIPTNEPWTRDHGPAFLTGGDRAVVDFGFNAWGGKYPPWDDDDRVPTRVADLLDLRAFDAGGVVVEGGAVEFDGRGTVLTTVGCLDNPNRNPGLSRGDIDRVLLDFYGQSRVIWLDPAGGIAGDDTDGHVDMLVRFVDERTIVVGVEPDPADVNHEPTADLARQCRGLGEYRVIELPMPEPMEIEGQRVPATYLNFYFARGGLLVPTYGTANDAAALDVLRGLLPGREVVGVDCRELIWGLGAVHCLTQQQPA